MNQATHKGLTKMMTDEQAQEWTVKGAGLTIGKIRLEEPDYGQMLSMPIQHYLGPIYCRMTNNAGYDHHPVTLGEVLAQAMAEALQWDESTGTYMDVIPGDTFVLSGVLTPRR